MAPVFGRPMIEWPVAALSTTKIDQVIVVLGANAPIIERGADLGRAIVVVSNNWQSGQSASLRCAIDAAENLGADALVVALGDQPLLSADAVDRVVAARGMESVVRATYGDRPGHPVVLERTAWPRLRQVEGDTGARGALDDLRVLDVPCDGLGCSVDIDTVADLTRLEDAYPRLWPKH